MLKPMEHFAPPTGQHPGPSRIDAVVSGELSWTEVDLVDLAGGETEALRSVLETYGVRVNRFPVGQPRHLVAALGGVRQAARYVVLSCHGADGGILLDELIPEVARNQPFLGSAGPDEIRAHLRFPGSVVISTGCDTGTRALADAVFDAGGSAYLAPESEPFGHAAVFAVLYLFYELTEGRTLEQAVATLREHDAELAKWRLFLP